MVMHIDVNYFSVEIYYIHMLNVQECGKSITTEVFATILRDLCFSIAKHMMCSTIHQSYFSALTHWETTT